MCSKIKKERLSKQFNKSKLRIKIVLVLKSISMIGVYLSFNNGNYLHSLPAITCSVALFFVKLEAIEMQSYHKIKMIEIEFCGLILIFIPLIFACNSKWQGNLYQTIFFEGVSYLFADAIISLVVSWLIWIMSRNIKSTIIFYS